MLNLSYVGRMSVKAVGKPLEILANLNELAGFQEIKRLNLLMCSYLYITYRILSLSFSHLHISLYMKLTNF
jgi:hypothetical protein